MKNLWLLVLVCVACKTNPIELPQRVDGFFIADGGGGDGDGGGDDGGGGDGGGDGGGGSCQAISDEMQTFIATHRTCNLDTDCEATSTPCGTPGQCGVYLRTGDALGLAQLEAKWNAISCSQGASCPPCAAPGVSACDNGVCGPPRPILPGGDIGRRCTTPADCAPGLLCDPNFGCSLACDTGSCPAGSVCKTSGFSEDGGVPRRCARSCMAMGDCGLGICCGAPQFGKYCAMTCVGP